MLALSCRLAAELEGSPRGHSLYPLSPLLQGYTEKRGYNDLDVIPLAGSFDKTLFFKRNHKPSAFFKLPGKSELIDYRHACV